MKVYWWGGMLLPVITIGALAGCSETEPCCCDYVQVTELFSSGIPVSDTLGVQAAFSAYTTDVEDKGLTFSDGSTDWDYVQSSQDIQWDAVQYWHVLYSVEGSTAVSPTNTYVDERENVVLLEISIHAPC